jgi:ATP-dependent Clp protease ATP-binding subunit ClpC
MDGFGGFSENVVQSLAQARREAAGFRHEYIGTEHVLLGIVSNPENIAVALLASRGVRPDVIRDRIGSAIKRGTVAQTGPDLPFTSRAKRILELAMSEARDVEANSVNTGHLFVGVIREEKGIGASVLGELGFTVDAARNQLVELTREGRTEIRTTQGEIPAMAPPPEMQPSRAAGLLSSMLRSPRVAAVFEKHGIDVQAVIRDLLEDQPSA